MSKYVIHSKQLERHPDSEKSDAKIEAALRDIDFTVAQLEREANGNPELILMLDNIKANVMALGQQATAANKRNDVQYNTLLGQERQLADLRKDVEDIQATIQSMKDASQHKAHEAERRGFKNGRNEQARRKVFVGGR